MQNIIQIIVAVLLVLAIGHIPYGYYTFLRWVVCIVAIYTTYLAAEDGLQVWLWIFVFVAILFNPLRPIYLAKQTWVYVDLLTASLFLIYAFWPTNSKKHARSNEY